jgi:hypothetical protein
VSEDKLLKEYSGREVVSTFRVGKYIRSEKWAIGLPEVFRGK